MPNLLSAEFCNSEILTWVLTNSLSRLCNESKQSFCTSSMFSTMSASHQHHHQSQMSLKKLMLSNEEANPNEGPKGVGMLYGMRSVLWMWSHAMGYRTLAWQHPSSGGQPGHCPVII